MNNLKAIQKDYAFVVPIKFSNFEPSNDMVMNQNKKFAVIGGGSWATAIAKMLCVNLDEIAWYMRNQSAIDHLKAYKHNPNYLSSVRQKAECDCKRYS